MNYYKISETTNNHRQTTMLYYFVDSYGVLHTVSITFSKLTNDLVDLFMLFIYSDGDELYERMFTDIPYDKRCLATDYIEKAYNSIDRYYKISKGRFAYNDFLSNIRLAKLHIIENS